MTEPRDTPGDELLERYADAVAQDPRRPSDRVRNAARAHAQMLRDQAAELQRADTSPPPRTAANQPHWKRSLLASLAVVGLAGLIFVQIDRGNPEDRAIALGTPPAPAALPAPAAAPTAGATDAPTDAPLPSSGNPSTRTEIAIAVPTSPARAMPEPPAVAPKPAHQRQAVVAAAPAEADARTSAAAHASTEAAEPLANAGAARESRRDTSLNAESSARAARPGDTAMAAASVHPAPAATAATAAPAAPAPVAAAAPPPPPAAAAAAAAKAFRTQDAARSPLETASMQFLDAARTGNAATLQVLSTQGVAVNTRDDAGNTALALAVRHRQAAAVRKLLELGADPGLTNREGQTALQIAQQWGFADMVQLLQAGR